jgi:Ulp1 family protease
MAALNQQMRLKLSAEPSIVYQAALNARKRTPLLPKDAHSKQLLLLPVNIENNHWVGIAVVRSAQLILVFDSMQGNNKATVANVVNLLKAVSCSNLLLDDDSNVICGMQDYDHHDGIGRSTRYGQFKVVNVDVGLQDNETECGVHMLSHFETAANAEELTEKLCDMRMYSSRDAIQSEKEGMRFRLTSIIENFKVKSTSG